MRGERAWSLTLLPGRRLCSKTLEALQAEFQQEYGDLAAQSQAFLYDEWDHIIGDYRRAWCRLTETILDDAGIAFVEETRQRHAELFAQVSRQFQLLKPDTFHARETVW